MYRACADLPMKPYLALLLLVASLTACARESGTLATPANHAAASPQTAAPSVAAAASAAAADAASVSDVAVAAKTQQEGADTGKGADSRGVALERDAALASEGQLPAVKWVAGTNYRVLSPAQPTDVAPGKIEVIEFFWYGCPPCAVLEPYLQDWREG